MKSTISTFALIMSASLLSPVSALPPPPKPMDPKAMHALFTAVRQRSGDIQKVMSTLPEKDMQTILDAQALFSGIAQKTNLFETVEAVIKEEEKESREAFEELPSELEIKEPTPA